MNFNGINSFSGFAPSTSLEPRAGQNVAGSSSGSFGSAVRDAVESMDNTQKGAEREIASAVTGESPDLHKTIVALQAADLRFQFGLQVRNKVIDAYQEIMRMQV